MPVPTLITDLSVTAASNYPAGSDSPSTLDDVQRAHAAFIAQLRDGKGFSNPVTLVSASTTDIGAQSSLSVEISGTTTITSFGTAYNGPRFLRFTGALVLTHASALNLPGAANITTAAGDTALAIPNLALTGWNVVAYQRNVAPGSASALSVTGSTAFGYGVGAGDAVTQITSKAASVTLNKPCGQVTLHNAALAANTTVSFQINNTSCAANDVIIVNHVAYSGTQAAYLVWAQPFSTGIIINVRNITAGSLSEAIVLAFNIVKGAVT